MGHVTTGGNRVEDTTLEAFADTIIPGEKRSADDIAVAGAAPGGGAVAAGALELLRTPAAGIEAALGPLVTTLNGHASDHAQRHGLALDESLPPFVALPFAHRTALVAELTGVDHPEKEAWVVLALFCTMAYDSAAHLPTADAVAAGHPGLTAMGFQPPDDDGLWRFTDFSYRRPLARTHPDTTTDGSPA